jgi:cation diffusion facilitator CzcD-associated flavoprotein CzcO
MSAAGRVCVIGAGASGIAACRALHERGIELTCFERSPYAGGLWRYPSASGGSCAYPSLFPNTSKRVMEYPSHPMPDDYPHYPHHTLVARYLDEVVDDSGFRDAIRFGADVASVTKVPSTGWRVELADGEAADFAAVIVASGGRHGEPAYAHLPGRFDGRELHSFDYGGPGEFSGQSVVVLGLGRPAPTSRARCRAWRHARSSRSGRATTWCPSC